MTYSEFESILSAFQVKCMNTLYKKGQDYANDNDAFVNFKTSALVAGIKPTQSCLVLIGTKLSRLKELLGNDKHPAHESIEDTVLDLGCYVALLHGMLKESKAILPDLPSR